MKRKIREIAKAGFDAVALHWNTKGIERMVRDEGMEVHGAADIGKLADVQPRLEALAAIGARTVNVQLCDHDTPTAEALPVVMEVIRVGNALGLKNHIEVHRDTCTETPEKTYALADAYEKATGEKLRMNFDFSHIAVIKHVWHTDYTARLLTRRDLLQVSQLIHLRPFNGQHCQVAVTNGHGKLSPEFEVWLPFSRDCLACWLETARSEEVLTEVPELGCMGSHYGISSFPDIWKDVIRLRKEIDQIWKGLIRNWNQKTVTKK